MSSQLITTRWRNMNHIARRCEQQPSLGLVRENGRERASVETKIPLVNTACVCWNCSCTLYIVCNSPHRVASYEWWFYTISRSQLHYQYGSTKYIWLLLLSITGKASALERLTMSSWKWNYKFQLTYFNVIRLYRSNHHHDYRMPAHRTTEKQWTNHEMHSMHRSALCAAFHKWPLHRFSSPAECPRYNIAVQQANLLHCGANFTRLHRINFNFEPIKPKELQITTITLTRTQPIARGAKRN